ncbi:mitochondrial nicotinamide adenine dinucleotide transporter SLC25A51 [Eupeodes corollae]|uniref:mitochondrial nicotinamide adenine dinucleotide transporter SLC25A51 n=1 Tax=Eupeodes corollae TaxID=290404 RepID=UPI0024939A95|nr:mitochondrial nicotinamide adenine dinucleotide transporter SLC25A51 [Eupeodes corollae]XP_055904106.1 mitochondrial nicotinamide adenine dinucleotide transporter SLC25A51 [Eupeodes corollae]
MSDAREELTTMEGIDTRLIVSFDWHEFACGCGAAFVNLGLTYPIYKLIFRQMLHGVGIGSAFDQLRNEGITYLYRGIFPPLAQKTVSLSIMFGVYDGTRRMLVEGFQMNNYAAKIISGLTAGTFEGALLPFERVQTLLADSKFHHHFKNTPAAFRYVIANHGFLELYRGMVPVLIRNGPSNAAFFVLREEANARIPNDASLASRTMQEFIAGAVIGASLSTIFYPMNVIKVSMQSEMGHQREKMWTVCQRIYHERGGRISYFFRGCGFNAFRSFMSWGVMNTAYEKIKELIT